MNMSSNEDYDVAFVKYKDHTCYRLGLIMNNRAILFQYLRYPDTHVLRIYLLKLNRVIVPDEIH